MTTKARTAQTPKPAPTEKVGDAAAQTPSTGGTTPPLAAGNDENAAVPATPATAANQPTAADAVGDPAPPVEQSGTAFEIANRIAELRDVDAKPVKKKPKAKHLAPGDDPTAGITGVPVDYVPTPAVP